MGKGRFATALRRRRPLWAVPLICLVILGLFLLRPHPSVKLGKFVCSTKRFLGDSYGGWTLCVPPTSLRGALVYTVGVGRNIEWDKAMIQRFGTEHHGWDPTPTAIDFFKKKAPPTGFTFHRYGLGAHDGAVTVKLPEGNQDSYTIMGYAAPAQKGTVNSIRVRTMQTMMKMLRHNHLAILKIDIEGAEFDVIKDWVRTGYRVPADQILIEFHERYFGTNKRSSLVPQAIRDMRQLGFEVFHRAKLEISFIRNYHE